MNQLKDILSSINFEPETEDVTLKFSSNEVRFKLPKPSTPFIVFDSIVAINSEKRSTYYCSLSSFIPEEKLEGFCIKISASNVFADLSLYSVAKKHETIKVKAMVFAGIVAIKSKEYSEFIGKIQALINTSKTQDNFWREF